MLVMPTGANIGGSSTGSQARSVPLIHWRLPAGFVGAKRARSGTRRVSGFAKGLDPTIERNAGKARAMVNQQLTFEAMANQWFEEKKPGWSPARKCSAQPTRP